MSNYVIPLDCTECGIKFHGITPDHPLGNSFYHCTCPSCSKGLVLPVRPGYIQGPIPEGSVKISMTKKRD